MAYYMLVKGRAGICRGASSYRKDAGWHDVRELGRPLSDSGYVYRGRDELHRKVEVTMVSETRSRQIAELLSRDKVLPWVAIEAAYNDTAQQWWTFFDVELGGYAAGTDYSSPTGGFVSYIFAFGSARYNSGTWPGAIRTEIPKVGLDPGNAVVRDTNQAISALPVPASLKRP